MFHAALFLLSWGATQPDALSPQARGFEMSASDVVAARSVFAEHASFTDGIGDERVSVALVFEESIPAEMRRRVRQSSANISGLEIQPETDTERLFAQRECADQWLSCQILTGRELGVEKLIWFRLLSSDALSISVVDIRLEVSRGEIVVPWIEAKNSLAEVNDDALTSRLRTALLVLLREVPVWGNLVVQGKALGAMRVDGWVVRGTENAEHLFTLTAGSHLLEIENAPGDWQSIWVEVPGESRVVVAVPSPQTSLPHRAVVVRSGFSSGLMSAGAVTTLGSAGFWGFATWMSNQPVTIGTSSAEVEQRLKLLERGQQSAAVLAGVGVALLGLGILLEFHPTLAPNFHSKNSVDDAKIN